MPRAGLAEPARELLRAAVADEETVARFRAKIVTVPGSPCTELWAAAVSGRSTSHSGSARSVAATWS